MVPPRVRRSLPAIFVGVLVVACSGLAWLQYQWISELGRLEAEQVRANLRGQAEAFARAFDRELAQAVMAYLPQGFPYTPENWREVHRGRALAAASRQVRPMFSQLAVARPNASRSLDLYFLDPASGNLTPGDWPREWSVLREDFLRILQSARGRPPAIPRASSLLEAPILGETPHGEAAGWMIFEVDRAYFRNQWAPDLSAAYLNSTAGAPLGVRIVSPEAGGETIFVSPAAPEQGSIVIPFFPLRLENLRGGGRPPGPPGFAGRRGPPPGAVGPGGSRPPGRWLLEVGPTAQSSDSLVDHLRRRNLALSFLLLGLIGAGGVLLIRATFRARHLAELQFQFLAGVSHELRTPLTVIRGAAHNLLSGIVADEKRRRSYLEAIAAQSAQLADMVEQLLAYAKTRNEAPVEIEPVEVSGAVSEAIESLHYELQRSGATLDLDIPADLPAVWVEAAGLRRALVNLIGNAAKHGGRQIVVAAREIPAGVEIRVSDDGEGIAPEEAARIFEAFYRGERARASKIRGTGLGLNLVRQVVEAAGGSVALESKPGQGASFVIRLRTEAPTR